MLPLKWYNNVVKAEFYDQCEILLSKSCAPTVTFRLITKRRLAERICDCCGGDDVGEVMTNIARHLPADNRRSPRDAPREAKDFLEGKTHQKVFVRRGQLLPPFERSTVIGPAGAGLLAVSSGQRRAARPSWWLKTERAGTPSRIRKDENRMDDPRMA